MGMDTAVAAFEKTIGMPSYNQRYILSRIRDMRIEDKAGAVMDRD